MSIAPGTEFIVKVLQSNVSAKIQGQVNVYLIKQQSKQKGLHSLSSFTEEINVDYTVKRELKTSVWREVDLYKYAHTIEFSGKIWIL